MAWSTGENSKRKEVPSIKLLLVSLASLTIEEHIPDSPASARRVIHRGHALEAALLAVPAVSVRD